MDIDKDKKGGLARTHQNSLKIIHEMKENLDLVDVWRIFNPDDKRSRHMEATTTNGSM